MNEETTNPDDMTSCVAAYSPGELPDMTSNRLGVALVPMVLVVIVVVAMAPASCWSGKH